MSAASKLSIVHFHEDELLVVGDAMETAYVVLRPACEALGLDFSSQVQRLKRQSWARVVVTTTHDATGRKQEMFCLHLDSFPMWLATISSRRVRPEVRGKLELFQKEAAKVLAAHFLGKQPSAPAPLALLPSVAEERLRCEALDSLEAGFRRRGTFDAKRSARMDFGADLVLERLLGSGVTPERNGPLTVADVAQLNGFPTRPEEMQKLGRHMASCFRKEYGHEVPDDQKAIQRFENGREDKVNAYLPHQIPFVESVIREWFARPALIPPRRQLELLPPPSEQP